METGKLKMKEERLKMKNGAGERIMLFVSGLNCQVDFLKILEYFDCVDALRSHG